MNDDSTLGGYVAQHERPPAFEGPDGAAYSASVFVEDVVGDDGSYGAAVLFVRWSEHGERPVGHVESPLVAFGTTPEEARDGVLSMSLHRLKNLLDDAVLASQERPAW